MPLPQEQHHLQQAQMHESQCRQMHWPIAVRNIDVTAAKGVGSRATADTWRVFDVWACAGVCLMCGRITTCTMHRLLVLRMSTLRNCS